MVIRGLFTGINDARTRRRGRQKARGQDAVALHALLLDEIPSMRALTDADAPHACVLQELQERLVTITKNFWAQ